MVFRTGTATEHFSQVEREDSWRRQMPQLLTQLGLEGLALAASEAPGSTGQREGTSAKPREQQTQKALPQP